MNTETTPRRPISAETLAAFRECLEAGTERADAALLDAERFLAECQREPRTATDLLYATHHRDAALAAWEENLDLCRAFAVMVRRVA